MSVFVSRCLLDSASLPDINNEAKERTEILNRLVRERENIRYLIAPSGYGKTTVAVQYVKMMFPKRMIFWCDCSSPCFLRDLLTGDFADHFETALEFVPIAIFDNLPHLDSAGWKMFNELCKTVQLQGSEVLVLSTPEANDCFLNKSDLKVFKPKDFLFIDAMKPENAGVPVLCNNPLNADKFFGSVKKDGLRRCDLLVYFTMLIYGEGSTEDIVEIADLKRVATIFRRLSSFYPHISVDEECTRFKAVGLPVEFIKRGLQFALPTIAKSSRFDTGTHLIYAMCDHLLKKGDAKRAQETLFAFCSVYECAQWGIENTLLLVDSACPSFLYKTLDLAPQQMKDIRNEIYTSELVAQFSQGDLPKVVEASKALFRSHSSSFYQRLLSCLLSIVLYDFEDRESVCSVASELVELGEEKIKEQEATDSCRLSGVSLLKLNDLVLTYVDNKHRGFMALIDEIGSIDDQTTNGDICALAIFSQLVLSDLMFFSNEVESFDACCRRMFGFVDDAEPVTGLVERLLQFIFATASEKVLEDSFEFEILTAARVAMNLCDLFEFDSICELTDEAKSTIEALHLKRIKDSIVKDQEEANDDSTDLHPRVKVKSIKDPGRRLNIQFFGGVKLELDDQYYDTNLTRRKNPVFLLYLLSKNLGREVSREEIMNEMWGFNGVLHNSSRNFYSTCSILKGYLNKDTGFEFVKKSANGYYLDSYHCRCDLAEFDKFCNNLTFDPHLLMFDMDKLARDAARFSRPLLPLFRDKPMLEEARLGYQRQLLDAFMIASVNFLENRDYRNALWFAQQAKKLDRSREDVYSVIMQSQNGLNMRSAAFSTYFECKEILDVNYGISPSSEIQKVYKTLLE